MNKEEKNTMWVKKSQYGFSTTLKDKNDKEIKMYLDVQFPKENQPKGNCQVDIKRFFMSCFKSKDGVKPKIVIRDYEILQEEVGQAQEEVKEEDPFADFGDFRADDIEIDF